MATPIPDRWVPGPHPLARGAQHQRRLLRAPATPPPAHRTSNRAAAAAAWRGTARPWRRPNCSSARLSSGAGTRKASTSLPWAYSRIASACGGADRHQTPVCNSAPQLSNLPARPAASTPRLTLCRARSSPTSPADSTRASTSRRQIRMLCVLPGSHTKAHLTFSSPYPGVTVIRMRPYGQGCPYGC